jgi:hypothetical protein
MNDRFTTTGVICLHSSTVVERLPEGSTHYARLLCKDCRTFLRFLPKPENVERRKLNRYRLAKLQMSPGLTDWERQFVTNLAKLPSGKLSPRQQEVFDRVYADRIEGEAVAR